MQKPLDPLSVERTETPSASYVLRRRYGPARHVIAVASWVTVISMLFQPVAVLAGTVTWDGGGANNNWSTGDNWTGSPDNAVPGTGDDVLFYQAGAQRLATGVIDTGFTSAINSLTFGNSQSGAVTIGGTQALTINAGGLTVNSSLGAVSISAPITLGGSQPWVNNSSSTLTVQTGTLSLGANTLTVGGTGNTTITAPITGTGSLTKTGDGTVAISNATLPSFDTITLSGGKLQLANQSGSDVINTFTYTGSTANFAVPLALTAKVLVVAGGGGGGKGEGAAMGDGAGGGGAGGLIYNAAKEFSAGNYTIYVGDGGAGSTGNSARGVNGQDSYIQLSVSDVFRAIGGGGGGSDNYNEINQGADGGSGGGAASSHNQTWSGGSERSGQGKAGGSTSYTSGTWGPRGGAGGGGAGLAGTSEAAGDPEWRGKKGGNGLSYSISGSDVTYAGGGGGGNCRDDNGTPGGAGGSGGGGAGGGASTAGGNGTNGLGGGGGGGGGGGVGGKGGSGIVIVSYNDFVAVNIPNTHIAADASSTLDLTAAAADHTLGKFSVAGGATLAIANAKSVTLPGLSGTSIAAYGSGLATISGTANLKPVGDISAPTGTSLSITAPVVINTAGTRNVTGNVTMASLDLSSATGTLNATQPLAISSTLKVKDGNGVIVTGTYTPEGSATSFSASGSDLASSCTLTLGGGNLQLKALAAIIGTGGAVTQVGGNVIRTFLNTGDNQTSYTLNLPESVSASVLVVAGGGGGGARHGAGGGAGGLIYYGTETPLNGHAEGVTFTIPAGDTTVRVGKGGTGYTNGDTTPAQPGTAGYASQFGSITADGGGYGAGAGAGGNGGSGGGSGYTSATVGTATTGQGFAGGSANGTSYAGGGGGGAGGLGGGTTSNNGGAGGVGLQYSISGTPTWYAGGGGGGSWGGGGGTRGSGIGGIGVGSGTGGNGDANTGSGGGGGFAGGNGGSGIVIVSYALGPSAINLSSTHIAATASSTLDLVASGADHILGDLTLTGTTLTIKNANSVEFGNITASGTAGLAFDTANGIKVRGTLRPGANIGQLTVAKDISHAATSTLAWEAKGYTTEGNIGTAGTDYSQVAMTAGKFTIANGTKLAVYFPTGEDFSGSFWYSNHTWDIITGGSNGSGGSIANDDISVYVNNALFDGGDRTITGKGDFSTAYVSDGKLQLKWTTTLGTLYTVTFDANGGTGTMTAQAENVPTALTANTFTREGYAFAGWNTAANGSGTAYANGATYVFDANITLFAQWTALPMRTVTFDANGGTGTMTPQTANVPTALTANAFTRVFYTFAGWNTAANGSGTAYANGATYAFAANVTLYAQWTVHSLGAGSGTWKNGTGDQKWSTNMDVDNNWAGGFPSAAGHTATFDSTALNYSGTGAAVVNVDAPMTIGALTFNGSPGTTSGYTLSGDVLTLTSGLTVNSGAGTVTISSNITIGGSRTFQNASANALTISGQITGTGGLSIYRSTTVRLTNTSNTYTGATTVSGSTVLEVAVLANGGVASSIGNSNNTAGNLVLNQNDSGPPTLRYIGTSDSSTDRLFAVGHNIGFKPWAATLDVAGVGKLSFTNTGSIVGSGLDWFAFNASNAGVNTFAPLIPAGFAGAIRKTGSGEWDFTNSNTYAVPTYIEAGTLGAAVLANGGTASSIGQSGNAAANLVFGAPTATLKYIGSANATTDRGFTMSSGTGGGATLDASGAGSITFDNTVAIAYGTADQTRVLTLTGTSTAANEFGKVLANNGTGASSLVKNGTGLWKLTAANTYTGTTTVNAGTLLVNGTLDAQTSAVTVNGTGTLGGTGTINRPVNVSGGTLKPPTSGTDKLTVGTLTMGASTFKVTGSGTSFGWVEAGGSVALSSGGNTELDVSEVTSPTATEIVLMKVPGASGNLSGTFNGKPEGTPVTVGGKPYKITYAGGDGNDVSLVFAPGGTVIMFK